MEYPVFPENTSRKLFTRILRNQSYESDLAAYGDRFENNKQELQLCLTVWTNLKLNQVTDLLSVMMLFNLVRSPKEKELMELIDKEGGPSKVMQDPVLLQKIIKGSENNNRDRGALQAEEDQKLVSLVQSEICQDLQNLVKTNETAFIQKFEAQKKSLINTLRENVDRLGDQVITAHWRGSAKACDLVLALRDYYNSCNQSALDQQKQLMQETVSPTTAAENDSEASHISEAIVPIVQPTNDQWALHYINLIWIQPLMEAFDDDASGFVTINEANALCAGRPENWSLPHWMAYWAVGFQMALIHYHMHIQTLLQQMHTAAEQTLPPNQVFIDSFLAAVPFTQLDSLLSGFQEQMAYGYGIWNWSDWSMFLPYVQDEEKRLKAQLEAFQLGLIRTGILWSSLQSVGVIMDAVDVRVDDLQAIFKHKNLDEVVMMRKSVYGLFSAWRSGSPHKELHKYTPLELTSDKLPEIDQMLASFISLKPTLLDYTRSDDINIAPSNNDSPVLLNQKEAEGFSAVIGTWIGSYHYGEFQKVGDGFSMFSIKVAQADGIIMGSGTDAIGEFTIEGKLSLQASDSTRVIFRKSYLAVNAKWRYEGIITSSSVMEGKWGNDDDKEGMDDFETPRWTDNSLGWFSFDRHLIERHLLGFWPSDDELEDLGVDPSHVLCRARWLYAIRIVLQRIRRKAMSWNYLKERQAQRRQFIDLVIQRDCRSRWLPYVSGSVAWDMMDTLQSLECTLYPQDIQLYRSLAWFKASRQIIQCSNDVRCDICNEHVIGSRFMCLDCLREYDDNTADFCVQHFQEYFVRNNKIVHTRYHPLLQLRRCLATRRLFSVADSSRAALKAAKESLADPSGHPECANCKQNVMPPCWFCVDCEDEFFLCFECNAKDNATEPCMTDKHLHPEEGHTYVHKLVLCPESKPDEPKAPSVDKRLEATEKHMEMMEKHMEEMEKHMEATKVNMENHMQATEKRIEVMEKHIEETKKLMEATQCSLQELLELQKENSTVQKRIKGMST
ncbi:hypothetical protein ARMGADRAFT_1098688 [Armillaria gallica]|uniref:ZZ-type domain-containing protein n=1 Tax=Armillaria gallica TaxID=47427 RepID=A0A2H3CLV1_ARMGA|nr:hypothetical protein ARMGADRAFT_1098688 [Armillaria gallica]